MDPSEWKALAEQGNMEAQNNLAGAYCKGRRLRKDDAMIGIG
jgi:TPR repeat protein